MNAIFPAALAATLVVLSVPAASAQSAATPEATGPAETAADPAAPPLWLVSCSNAQNREELLCEVSQSIVLTQGNQRVASAAFLRVAGQTQTLAAFAVPFGVAIPAGVRVSVDDTEVAQIAYQSCDAQGCYASTDAGEEWLAALRGGEQMTLLLTARDGQEIRLAFPLTDFAGVEALMP